MPTINTDGTCLCGIQAHTCAYHKLDHTIKLDDVELAARGECVFLREEALDSYTRVFYYCRAPGYNANFTF